jgi:hypothetical protein
MNFKPHNHVSGRWGNPLCVGRSKSPSLPQTNNLTEVQKVASTPDPTTMPAEYPDDSAVTDVQAIMQTAASAQATRFGVGSWRRWFGACGPGRTL